MSQNIQINITSTGADLGPYNLFFVDSFGAVTAGPTSISKQVLTNGYQIVVDDNIVTVRIKSVNAQCANFPLDIAIPPPPSCPTIISPYNPSITFPNYNPEQESITVTIGNTAGIVYYTITGSDEQSGCYVPYIYYPPIVDPGNIINSNETNVTNRFFYFDYDPVKGTDVLVVNADSQC
jgi:hypothetical protein